MRFCLLALFCILPLLSPAQSNELDKKLDRAKQIAAKDGLDKADEYLVKLLHKEPGFGKGWDLLSTIRLQQYEKSKSMDGTFNNLNFTVEVKDENGEKGKADDSLLNQLKEMLTQIKPSDGAYNRLLYALRLGTLHAPDEATGCSYMLRNLLVDVEIDSNVDRKALRFYNDAEEQFGKGNYASAAKLYQRALDVQPDFYKARLYLGDSYYFTENYADAARVFGEATKKFPFLVEPRKFLTDAYAKMNLYDRAIESAIISFTVYPDVAMRMRLPDVAYMNNQRFTLAGTLRGAFPARGSSKTMRGFSKPESDDTVKPAGPWVHYAAAMSRLASSYDEQGILKPGNAGLPRYHDVACWEAMLKESNDPSLDEARAAQKAGNLDCYALVVCFHHDVHPQYLDFMKRNREKVVQYYTKAVEDAR